MAFPIPGQSVEPATAVGKRWWPNIPWVKGAEDPIVSTKLN